MVHFIKDKNKAIEQAVQFIKNEVEESKTKGVVIGLSGGIDSAIIAYLSVRALGKEKVTLIHLPEEELDSIHTDDAQIVADDLEIPLKITSISPMLKASYEMVPNLKQDELAKGNVKARIRAVVLYSIANLENRLVAGTSNKSEIAIGYGTKFGDLAADMWPIGDLYKTELFEIAELLGINNRIITKPPTAGLWKGQTDEKEIGVSYAMLDLFLIGKENGKDDNQLAKELNLKETQVVRIKKLISRSHHKRHMPKMLHVKRE